MKKLSEFVSLLAPDDVRCFEDIPIAAIVCRPEECQPEESQKDALYCVIDEFLEYGHWAEGAGLFASAAPERVAALVVEDPIPDMNLPQLVVRDARQAMAQAAKHLFDSPDEGMGIVGITGTNGKTTTAHLTNHLLTACGERSAALGTLGLHIGGTKHAETIYTTPLSPTLFETLAELREMGVRHLTMEISSHGLKLDRVFGLDTDVAVFTNLTRDHLDFHETMADYRASKLKLFTRLKPEATAVVNTDDETGRDIRSLSPCPVIGYGCHPGAELRAEDMQYAPTGTAFRIAYQGRRAAIRTSLLGDFNVYNMLAALGVCLSMGIDLEALEVASPSLTGAAGRIEPVPLPGGRVGIVDYAHTPDSLEKVLRTLRGIGTGRIVTVFGCGGDRDRGKRPLMGETVARLSDLSLITSDNPRREDPGKIIEDILAGMPKPRVMVEPDRRKAIRWAFDMSRSGDIILVAGKGHEPYQIIGDERFPFDDREELRCLSESPTA